MAETETCGACRFYKEENAAGSVLGSPAFGICQKIGHDRDDEAAWTMDREGYKSELRVTPGFGCVLYKPTEAQVALDRLIAQNDADERYYGSGL